MIFLWFYKQLELMRVIFEGRAGADKDEREKGKSASLDSIAVWNMSAA